MLKKIIIIFFVLVLSFQVDVFAKTDKNSKEYLQSRSHVSIFKPLVEGVVERSIKSALKKETGSIFDVRFSGYTVSSMKKGIFKYLELSGNNVNNNGVIIPYVHLKSLTDYNYIAYNKNPIEFKSDMVFAYDLVLTEDTLNKALENSEYTKLIKSVNKLSSPIFVVKNVRTKIVHNKMYLVIDYNFPIIRSSKDKSFVASYDLAVEKGIIKAKHVKLDSVYGNISYDRITDLVNYLNPLEFTLDLLDSKQCKGNVENVKIVDNKIKVDGKIMIKGD